MLTLMALDPFKNLLKIRKRLEMSQKEGRICSERLGRYLWMSIMKRLKSDGPIFLPAKPSPKKSSCT